MTVVLLALQLSWRQSHCHPLSPHSTLIHSPAVTHLSATVTHITITHWPLLPTVHYRLRPTTISPTVTDAHTVIHCTHCHPRTSYPWYHSPHLNTTKKSIRSKSAMSEITWSFGKGNLHTSKALEFVQEIPNRNQSRCNKICFQLCCLQIGLVRLAKFGRSRENSKESR